MDKIKHKAFKNPKLADSKSLEELNQFLDDHYIIEVKKLSEDIVIVKYSVFEA